jgi:predicted  nucleic acid-binding Zn-ribbon protein
VALLAKHRGTIHQKLSPLIGDEEAEALLAQFPSRDDEEPITKHHLDSELAKLRSELRGEMKDLRTEVKEDIGKVRVEMKELRTEVKGEIADLRLEVSDLRGYMNQMESNLRGAMSTESRRLIMWVTSVVISCMAVAGAIGNAVG